MPSFLSKITDAMVTLLVGSVAGFVFVSLLLTLNYHAGGFLDWEKLGQIGEFWGGHLSSVALIFLGMTLLLQRQQYSAEQKHLSEEVETLRLERAQRELFFTTEQLREESGRLAFRRYSMINPQEWHEGPIEKGLTALEEAWNQENESGSLHVLTSRRELQSYLQVAEEAGYHVSHMSDPSIQRCQTFLRKLSPPWLSNIEKERERLEDETNAFFAKYAPGTRQWNEYVQQGWRVKTHQQIASRWTIILLRDDLHRPNTVYVQGDIGDSIATVLDRALAKLENQ